MDVFEKFFGFLSQLFTVRRLVPVHPPQEVKEEEVRRASSALPDPSGRTDVPPEEKLRPWRLTQYYVASQKEHGGQQNVPVLRQDGHVLGYASPGFFSSLSLEGTGVMGNGKLVNVAGVYVPVDHTKYQSVWEYHKKYLSRRAPGYSGLVVENDRVTKAFAFREITQSEIGVGYGYDNGIPRQPFRTLAADLGRTKRSEPRYKGKGGLVPVGTRVYVKEFDGVKLPDGTVHDGWCVVNDTGGGIFGAHFDVFVGYSSDGKKVKIPHIGHIWFEGIDDRVPDDYEYGLKD